MLDDKDFFQEASKMQSEMIKRSWKPILLSLVLSVAGFSVAFAIAALIIKVIFF